MTRAEILEMAKNIVTADREASYGKPEDNFSIIASLWSNYLDQVMQRNKTTRFAILDSDDVAAMMILLKIARISTGAPKADNWIDIAGYAACGGEIQTAYEDETNE